MTSFRHALHEEHFDEISFLYEHRCTALIDVDYGLSDLARLDERIEAHLDALLLGEEVAIGIAQENISTDDAGTLYAVTRLCCRSDKPDLVLDCLGTLDWNEHHLVSAMAAALQSDLPMDWTQIIAGWLGDFHPRLTVLLAEAAGYRRLPLAAEIQTAAATADASLAPRFLRALGMLGDKHQPPSCLMLLYAHMQKSDALAARTAAIAGLRLRDADLFSSILSNPWPWSPVPLALVGDSRVFLYLRQFANTPESSVDAVIAFGLLGDIRAVPPLLELLSNKELGNHAAASLYLLTGEAFLEEVPMESDDDDDDQALDDDNPLPEAEPDTTRQLSTDIEIWSNWWTRNQQRYRQNQRYRLGKLYSPLVGIDALRSTLLPMQVREYIGDELVARHGIDLRYAPDQPVPQQHAALTNAQTQAEQSTTKPGQWQPPKLR